MGFGKYLVKAKEYVRAYHELNGAIAESRVRNLKRAANNGTLEKYLNIAIPVSAGIAIAGALAENEIIRGLGIGALLAGASYLLIIPKKR